MKSLILALALAVVSIGFTPTAVEAKRIGGGGSSGMQRSMPPKAPTAAPAQQAAPTAVPPTAAAGPAAAPKRSLMGPIAGLAAGLGIAALMSHLGMGEAFGNFIMMALLAVVAIFAIRFVMARFGRGKAGNNAAPQGMQFAGAGNTPFPDHRLPASNGATNGASSGSGWGAPAAAASVAPAAAYAAPASNNLPAGFDSAGFERIAKMIFIRLQAANDTGDLNDLRTFTTPEMFASVRLELQDRPAGTQQTDVVKIDAEVLDFVAEADRQVVSVRFHGLIREEKDGVAAPFDEVWHLVKPADGSREWAIAGIQQTQAA
ncbi:hypothetical protein BH11PSE9_BH11PSE9_29300 [soil metagenome]